MGHHRRMTAWIDTHCHLDAPEFDADRSTVRREAAAHGVGHCVIPAVERSNWDTVRLLAHQHGDSYALGIHPLYTGRAGDGDLALLEEMLAQHHADPRLVAIGEIGLDYFVSGLDSVRQERFYRAQLQLARRFDLPVILHVRRSAQGPAGSAGAWWHRARLQWQRTAGADVHRHGFQARFWRRNDL